MPDVDSRSRESDVSQLCYVVGQLSGKVDLLVEKMTETMTSLVTERARIDTIDRRLAAFSVIGPILAVLVPSAISVTLALMMRPPVDRGLTAQEVLELRSELDALRRLQRETGERDLHFVDPRRYPPARGQGPSAK